MTTQSIIIQPTRSMETNASNQGTDITLYRFSSPDSSIYDISPFVNKLECVFRMTQTPYNVATGDVRKAPKHKLPFIQLSSGAKIGDSTLCYRYLIKNKGVIDIDAGLNEQERANVAAYKAWLEEWIYFLFVWEKYIDNSHLARESTFKQILPFYPLRVVVFFWIHRGISKMLHDMGILRHSREEIVSFIVEAVKNLSILIGEKGFLNGRDCSADAIAFGFLVAIHESREVVPIFNTEVTKYPNLIKWVEAMSAKYFPERELKYVL